MLKVWVLGISFHYAYLTFLLDDVIYEPFIILDQWYLRKL